ncbi:MAG TPA: hypothetical protein VFA78_09000 [Chloroflexota bacterium]|nr:hypothetical protein [Chloroflexota bacterium]
MTIAVSLNLPDGVILGIDSAVTILTQDGTGIAKVYEQGEKLFQLTDRPIGIAFYGAGGIGARSMGSYVREFALTDPGAVGKGAALDATVEALRAFLLAKYQETIVPALEKSIGKSFAEIPDDKKPTVGVVVGGFASDAHLSEVWNIELPANAAAGSATCRRKQGEFGDDWYARDDPIIRYLRGIDKTLLFEIVTVFEKIVGRSMTDQETETLREILSASCYQIPFGGMPMEEGVAYVSFLVGLVINHYRFAVGAPVVGGAVHLGKVTYDAKDFQLVT